MHRRPSTLINTPLVELWPAWLCNARSNRDARQLAGSRWLLRRKHDGRYLAAIGPSGMTGLHWHWRREPGMDMALAHVRNGPSAFDAHATLPLEGLQARLDALALDADAYAADTGLPLVPEPAQLTLAGFDRYRRPLWLLGPAARAWRCMHQAALREGVVLDAISGYRSHAYQLGIFARKRARGLAVADILAVNAAPGFSEHHGGRALDIGTPGEAPAEESFEHTPAFAWLSANAGNFRFHLSYPRGNPHGIVYEPWHWCWRGTADRAVPVS